MNSLHQAALLNNEGVRLLHERDMTGAFVAFQHALNVVQTGSLSDDLAPGGYEETAVRYPVACLACLPHFIHQCHSKLDSPDSANFFVYDRPFLISTTMSAPRRDDYATTLELFGSYIVFNFALACQQLGRMCACETSTHRARELYRILLHIVENASSIGSCGHGKSYEILKCVVYNNLAHLHYEQCQYKDGDRCIDIMLTLFRMIDGLVDFFRPDELSGILWNASHVRPPRVAAAA